MQRAHFVILSFFVTSLVGFWACNPEDAVPGGACLTLAEPECGVVNACVWEGDETNGFCAPAPVQSGCSALELVDCFNAQMCEWKGSDDGECLDKTGNCAELETAECFSNPDCGWFGGDDGECRPVLEQPSCEEMTWQECFATEACGWFGGDDGECRSQDTSTEPSSSSEGSDQTETESDTEGSQSDDPIDCSGLEFWDCTQSPDCRWDGGWEGSCVEAGDSENEQGNGAGTSDGSSAEDGADSGGPSDGSNGGGAGSDASECSGLEYWDCVQVANCAWEGGFGGSCVEAELNEDSDDAEGGAANEDDGGASDELDGVEEEESESGDGGEQANDEEAQGDNENENSDACNGLPYWQCVQRSECSWEGGFGGSCIES